MPRIKDRKRHNRWKAPSKSEKRARRSEFSKNHRDSAKTGLSHGPHDTVRSGLSGPFIYVYKSPSRCTSDCLFCKGSQPGCLDGERSEKKLRIYQKSVTHVEKQLREKNDGCMRNIVFFRTFDYLYYLRTFTFTLSFGNPSQVFFSLYDQSLTVQRNPHYPVEWVAFQNRLDSSPFLTWKREKRCIVLSPKQKNTLMYLGRSARFLAMYLVPNTQRCCRDLRFHILGRFFGQKSIYRAIKAGGLNPKSYTKQLRPELYFGE